jgi:archaemetzincin
MEIALLQIGKIEQDTLEFIRENLAKAFPRTDILILKGIVPPAPESYDSARKQYDSSLLLMLIREYARKIEADKILGITNADLYVPQLNFIFGEAESPGKAAIVSLYRLEPEFYGHQANRALFLERAAKEAIHETGHTFGLPHCPDSSCVMSFSNTIHAVDEKRREFCPKCSRRLFKVVR